MIGCHNKDAFYAFFKEMGLEESEFYKVASILMFELEHEFDLIDLDDKANDFSQMISKVGGLLKVG